jgi:hypothetical protein
MSNEQYVLPPSLSVLTPMDELRRLQFAIGRACQALEAIAKMTAPQLVTVMTPSGPQMMAAQAVEAYVAIDEINRANGYAPEVAPAGQPDPPQPPSPPRWTPTVVQ